MGLLLPATISPKSDTICGNGNEGNLLSLIVNWLHSYGLKIWRALACKHCIFSTNITEPSFTTDSSARVPAGLQPDPDSLKSPAYPALGCRQPLRGGRCLQEGETGIQNLLLGFYLGFFYVDHFINSLLLQYNFFFFVFNVLGFEAMKHVGS